MSEDKKENHSQTNEQPDLPLVSQQQSLLEGIKHALDPNNENPKLDEYITSTFSYVMQALYNISNAQDKQAASREVADDLKRKFDIWKENREKSKQENDGNDEKDNKNENDLSNEHGTLDLD